MRMRILRRAANTAFPQGMLGRLWRQVVQAWKTLRYNTAFPFYWCFCVTAHQDSAIRLHKVAHQFRFHHIPFFSKICLVTLLCIFWWFRLIELAIKYSKREVGEPRFRLAFRMLRFSIKHSVPPKAFYNFCLFSDQYQGCCSDFFYDHEIRGLFSKLNGFRDQVEIRDKLAFYKLCQLNQLPCVPVVTELPRGQAFSEQQLDELSASGELTQGFFIKPRFGAKGMGCQSWKRLDAQKWTSADGALGSATEITDAISTEALKSSLLFQPPLSSHESLADLSYQNICTARIVTLYRNNLDPVYFCGVLKIPRKNSSTNTSGLMSAIGFDSGLLGRAYTYRLVCDGMEIHPDNGAQIKGRMLPDWSSVKSLAIQAHRLFPGYLFLGWDIALTGQGPVLLEVNEYWDVLTIQRTFQTPLGRTCFTQLCFERLGWDSLGGDGICVSPLSVT